MARYTSGRDALAVCDRCGQRGRYVNMVKDEEVPGLLVHNDGRCLDERIVIHRREPDAIGLRDPRPDRHDEPEEEDEP